MQSPKLVHMLETGCESFLNEQRVDFHPQKVAGANHPLEARLDPSEPLGVVPWFPVSEWRK